MHADAGAEVVYIGGSELGCVLSPVYMVGGRVEVTVEGQSIVTVMVDWVCRPADMVFAEVDVG